MVTTMMAARGASKPTPLAFGIKADEDTPPSAANRRGSPGKKECKMLTRHDPKKFFHGAVEAGGLLHLSGLTASDRSQDLNGQTAQILTKLEETLHALGTDKGHVVSTTVYITDMDNKDQMNDAWLAFFPAGSLPARATVGVASLGDGVLIEVSCVAVRP